MTTGAALAGVVGSGPVLVLAPHADDESLGCGRLLAACWASGVPAHVACLTDGAASHPGSALWPAARLAALRRDELGEAVRRLGGDPEADVTGMGFPDAGLHRVDPAEVERAVAAVARGTGARALLAPAPEDPHCDHGAAARAAFAVARTRPELRVLTYPVWSRWHARGEGEGVAGRAPLRFADERFAARKRDAIDAHRSQMGAVVRDDPSGFAMPAGFAAFFAAAPELYYEARP